MFTSFGFWAFVLQIISIIVIVSGYIKITRNDLFHLQRDVTTIKDSNEKSHKEIREDINHLRLKTVGLCERVANIEGRLTSK